MSVAGARAEFLRMMPQLIIGAGEVGQAIGQILTEGGFKVIATVDKDQARTGAVPPSGCVMHVCFPYSDDFVGQVLIYRDSYKPSLVIIHSTVPVGTSTMLDAVHSPVMGRHPRLALDMHNYRKAFGGPRAEEAATYFDITGLATACFNRAEDTEAGKLWQTLQYGWLIALEKECKAFCDANGLEFQNVYREFNSMYNHGMQVKGESSYLILPILKDMPGPIGGHCVIENSQLLDTQLGVWLRKLNRVWGGVAER